MAEQRKRGDPFSSSLQRLDDELTCPVCSDHFREPKVLPCLHYYCKTCVADLIKRAKGVPFNCPECRRETTADGDNPDTLPTAFFVNRMEELFAVMKKAERKDSVACESCRSQLPAVDFCHDCSKYICTDCAKAHKQMWLLSSHHVVSIDSLRSTIIENPPEKLQVVYREVKCSKHKDEPLKLYCYSCNKLVCRDCIVIDHKDHKFAFVIDAAPLCKAEIRENSESVKKITEGVKSAVKSLGDSKKKLSDHGAEITRSIDQAIDEIIEKLAEKRREMKEKANRIVNEAEEKIAAEEKNAQLVVGELESLLEFMSRTLETATDQEILSLKKQVSDQVERVTELYIDADENFPVPELPELEVNCGTGVKEAIKSEISVAQRKNRKIALVSSHREPALPPMAEYDCLPPTLDCERNSQTPEYDCLPPTLDCERNSQTPEYDCLPPTLDCERNYQTPEYDCLPPNIDCRNSPTAEDLPLEDSFQMLHVQRITTLPTVAYQRPRSKECSTPMMGNVGYSRMGTVNFSSLRPRGRGTSPSSYSAGNQSYKKERKRYK